MISRQVRIQLVVFALIAVGALGYGAYRFAGLDELVNPPYTVRAEFAHFGGIYPQADVDLLGVRVGEVGRLRPGHDGGTVAELVLDGGTRIPADVAATVRARSAIGEQFIELRPASAGGPLLHDGSVIGRDRTASPPKVQDVLRNLNDFAAAIPKDDLATTLDELAAATADTGPQLQKLLEETTKLTRTNLDNLDELTALIDDSLTVLGTQVAEGPHLRTYSRELAELTTTLHRLDPTFARVFANGIRANTEVVDLLKANEQALPVLLTNLLALTEVTEQRLPALRKILVLYPWTLEIGGHALRYCDEYDATTGKPVPQTCHYDAEGRPIWAGHLASQENEPGGQPPYRPCTKGYEGTTRYLPDGSPARGSGPKVRQDTPFNPDARCAAAPTDPDTPNVRGGQNAQRPDRYRRPDVALYNPNSGVVATSDGNALRISGTTGGPPPRGRDGLAWLLVQPMS